MNTSPTSPPIIIILGTKVLPDGTPSKLLRERIEAGVALMGNRHPKATLVLSGKGSGPITEAQCMANLAHELLADTQCSEPEIILEQNSMNTAGNAKECSVLLGHDRDRQVIVVTHKSHMPRAMRLFQREKRMTMTGGFTSISMGFCPITMKGLSSWMETPTQAS